MAEHFIKNEFLSITVNEFGAELTSILNNKTNKQYLWNADPLYWKRHSPVLFPIVGSLKNKTYLYHGQSYSMSQHGFARDMEFKLIKKTDFELWYQLTANDETKKVYPFDFALEIGYRLQGRSLTVMWRVINLGKSVMYFSIGAHPAFMCPLDGNGSQEDYFISFDKKNPVHYSKINDSGLVVKQDFMNQSVLETQDGILPVTNHLFDDDALIIENYQCKQVSLLRPDQKPYVTVHFDAPLFGLWSPAGKNAPFICIEPWYGRCDSSDFSGTLEEREWGNHLEAGKQFEAAYTIEIG